MCTDTQVHTARTHCHDLFYTTNVRSPLNTEGTQTAPYYDFSQEEIECTQRTNFVSIDSYFMQ